MSEPPTILFAIHEIAKNYLRSSQIRERIHNQDWVIAGRNWAESLVIMRIRDNTLRCKVIKVGENKRLEREDYKISILDLNDPTKDIDKWVKKVTT